MTTPTPKTLQLMSIAATMRAVGHSWESVAAVVKRSSKTCLRWPAQYPDDWDNFFYPAARRLVEQIGTESRLKLKMLVRSKDEKISKDASKYMSQLMANAEASFDRKTGRNEDKPETDKAYTVLMEKLDENQRRAILDEYVLRRMEELRDAESGAESGAGAAVGQ